MHLKNRNADITVGVVNNHLYVQRGQMREYYGTVIVGKAERLLKLLMEWDRAGGNDEGIER